VEFFSCTVIYIESSEGMKESPPNYNYKRGEFVNSNPTKGVLECEEEIP